MGNIDKINQEALDHLDEVYAALETADSHLRSARDLVGDDLELLEACDKLISDLAKHIACVKSDTPDGFEDETYKFEKPETNPPGATI